MDLTRQLKNSGMKNSDYFSFYCSSNSSSCYVFLLVVVVAYQDRDKKKKGAKIHPVPCCMLSFSLVKNLHVSRKHKNYSA